jgi:hypothetical protein
MRNIPHEPAVTGVCERQGDKPGGNEFVTKGSGQKPVCEGGDQLTLVSCANTLVMPAEHAKYPGDNAGVEVVWVCPATHMGGKGVVFLVAICRE